MYFVLKHGASQLIYLEFTDKNKGFFFIFNMDFIFSFLFLVQQLYLEILFIYIHKTARVPTNSILKSIHSWENVGGMNRTFLI